MYRIFIILLFCYFITLNIQTKIYVHVQNVLINVSWTYKVDKIITINFYRIFFSTNNAPYGEVKI